MNFANRASRRRQGGVEGRRRIGSAEIGQNGHMPFLAVLRGLQGTEGIGGAIIDPRPSKSNTDSFRGVYGAVERLFAVQMPR